MNKFVEIMRKLGVEYFTLTPFLIPQAEAEQSIREGISFRGTNMIILILAIFIASLGLNTNSTAVIIGAMLISPLMGPIIGIGLGVGIHDFDLLKRSLRNLLMATVFSVATSALYFLISPVGQEHSELLARTSPTIYDVLIGFFGGAAGIVAIGSKSKGNVIPGVAIATALMPPLCTVGYGLATWQLHYFFGALYLFLINSIFIGLSTFIGVKLMKYQPAPTNNPQRAHKVTRIVYIMAILTLLPSIYLTYTMYVQSRFQLNTENFVKEECQFPSTHVLNTDAVWSRKKSSITITLIGKPMPQDSLVLALTSKLRFYGLAGTTLNIVQGSGFDSVDREALDRSSISDLYQYSMASIAAKQATIDSLRNVVEQISMSDSVAATLIPELKVVFPQITEIAISHPIMAQTQNGKLDTLNLALVNFSSPISQSKKEELSKYLGARLRLKDVQIISLKSKE